MRLRSSSVLTSRAPTRMTTVPARSGPFANNPRPAIAESCTTIASCTQGVSGGVATGTGQCRAPRWEARIYGSGEQRHQHLAGTLELLATDALVGVVRNQRVARPEVRRRHTVLPERRDVGPAHFGLGRDAASLHQGLEERVAERGRCAVGRVEHLPGV